MLIIMERIGWEYGYKLLEVIRVALGASRPLLNRPISLLSKVNHLRIHDLLLTFHHA
jgi:hypothetical protein